jgi:uncharacterized membrane protein YkvA (DUF1232 family)
MDIIPDLLVPIGWVDDLGVWALAIAAEIVLARRAAKKARQGNGQARDGQGRQA